MTGVGKGNEGWVSSGREHSAGVHTLAAWADAPPRRPPGAPTYLVDAGRLAGLRGAVVRHAHACGLPEDACDDLVLVANELATNVVRHGGGRGQMLLWYASGGLVCQVTDDGPGMAHPAAAGAATSAVDAVTGRGLWLVRLLGDWVHIASGPYGTTVTVSMAVDPQ
jgi:anti-sigma regulatory factor (Ser/Thr protein kinase)